MKKPFRLFSFLLAACVLAASFPTASAEGGRTHTVAHEQSVSDLFTNGTVQNGDTIQITGTGRVPATTMGGAATDTPWVIDKEVTITGGNLEIYTGGIVLDADATFKDITMSFTSNVRNAIIANGHTLTLENVTCGNHSFNLFCGGLLVSDNETITVPIPDPGTEGTIRIIGKTSIQKNDTFGHGNVYAGNLCMGGMNANENKPEDNGPENEFNGNAVITIEGGSDLGTVYACGAQQRIPVNQLSGKETTPNPVDYTVSGSVTVSGKVPDVEGAGSLETHVVYEDNGNGYQATNVFSNLSSLSVVRGDLALAPGSHDLDGAAVSLASGAKLNLAGLAARLPRLGDFSGDGFLILNAKQTLEIGGTVTGTTKVAIGNTNAAGTGSTSMPAAGHCYIAAPDSSVGAFLLLPNAAQPGMTLEYDGGNWITSGEASGGDQLVDSFSLNTATQSVSPGEEAEFEMAVMPEDVYLEYIPLEITVDGATLIPSADEYGYFTYADSQSRFHAEANNNLFYISAAEVGTYSITISVPAGHTVGNTKLTQTATLTVTEDAPPIRPQQIPVPQANTGLVWTGEELTGVSEGAGYTLTGHRASDAGTYTAVAALRSGYWWDDTTGEEKQIEWRIDKSTVPPAAPIGLAGEAPASAGGADGKITGTTIEMEYSASDDFAVVASCGERETVGLAAGTYYVRLKDNNNHVAGSAAQVDVPPYSALYVTGISIQTPADKTSYQVGETLDVTGLRIAVSYSDGSSQTVAVTADMVGGFDSSQATDSQTLIVAWEGWTVSYEIRVIEPDAPGQSHQHSWSTAWSASASHHWHSCTGENCWIQQDSEKQDYAAHTAGEWVVDQEATATQSGSRHKSCAICGYEMERETIPATGGGSTGGGSTGGGSTGGGSTGGGSTGGGSTGGGSTGGGSTGGGSTGGGSTGGGSTGGGSTGGGSTGGSSTGGGSTGGSSTGGGSSGTGTSTSTVKNSDGSSQTTVKLSNGTTASIFIDRRGVAQAQVSLSQAAVSAARRSNEAVPLPIPAVGGLSSLVKVTLPGASGAVKVKIPVENAAPGLVAVMVNPDGSETVVKKSAVAKDAMVLTLSGTAAVRLVNNGASFYDVPDSSWAKNAVDFVTARGIFCGTGGGEFSPDGSMTRGMLAVTLYNLEDSPDGRFANAFTDLRDNWYAKAVNWGAERGIISGYSNGQYRPDDSITREQLAVILWRYAGSPAATNKQLHFADADKASGYALEALRWAEEVGIINGGELMPQEPATRAQAAQMLMNLIQKM